jgi:hypothetical protein
MGHSQWQLQQLQGTCEVFWRQAAVQHAVQACWCARYPQIFPCSCTDSAAAAALVLQGYGNQRFVFQGVHETICYGPSDKPWGENETRINQIVFIGRKLDRKALMEGFR